MRHQRDLGIRDEEHQVPEPWNGAIATAPILFLSSNPSINASEVYPRRHWTDESLADFFEQRFEKWVTGGVRTRRDDGLEGKVPAVRFLSAVKSRAAELVPSPRPGVDYVLSEVVHCKSRSEVGVRSALGPCVDRYLEPVIEASGARVVVVLGAVARDAVRSSFRLPSEAVVGPALLAGRMRMVAFLPAPNAFALKTFARVMPDALPALRGFLEAPTE